MQTIKGIDHVDIKMWTDGVPVEDGAIVQLKNVAKLPIVWPHVSVMPDVHVGIGATVGSVIATKGAIIPSAVGVDLGCGCAAYKTNLRATDLPTNLAELRTNIEAAVPHGRTNNGGPGDRGAWGNPPTPVTNRWSDLLMKDYNTIIDKHPKAKAFNNVNHLGTLGSGNHFIEVCLDTENNVWFMLHSGSRGVGNRIGSYFIELAKTDMQAAHGNLPEDKDLCYLTEGTQHFDDYVQAVAWAQAYALHNREMMMSNVVTAVSQTLKRHIFPTEKVISCHHNYVNKEKHYGEDLFITRKGACSARKGELNIIPTSMGTKSFIVRGKGNEESFHSCSHGAGRVMSRNQAKKEISLADHVKATEGIECRKDVDVIDESPRAYKDPMAVMAAQSDLVEIVATLKQVLCVKG